MAVFIISYDLRGNGDYELLYQELEDLNAVRVLESVWSIKTEDMKHVDLRDHLYEFIDEDDGLIVVKAAAYATYKTDNKPHTFK